MTDSFSQYVWDLPLRLFHWLLVAAIIAGYITADIGGEWLYWHLHIGVFIFALIIFRLCWGFLGSENSQFKSFLPTPKRIKHYYNSTKPVTGHSPHSAASVFLLIFIILLQTLTGLFSIDEDTDIAGPLNELVNASTSDSLSYLHYLTFDILMIIVSLHILAIIIYKIKSNNNLIAPMLIGYSSLSVSNKYKPEAKYFYSKLSVSIAMTSFVCWCIESGQILSLAISIRNF